MPDIIIAGVKVKTDAEGRFLINDFHKLAGGENRHQPAFFFKRPEILELVEELNSSEEKSLPVNSVPGRSGGTYVCKELVYAYAMWLSPSFHLKVIRAFDALANGRIEDAKRIAARHTARLEAPHLTEAIKHSREVKGKAVAHYHFSNEFDLINRVALGKSAKEYRLAHNIPSDAPIREHLSLLEIKCIEALQRANTTLIDLGYSYEARKAELHKLYVLRHAVGLLAEVKRLES